MPDNIASNIKLYADDALLYRTIHSVTDTYILQHNLDMLHQWASTWLMTFNPTNCEFLQLTKKNHPLESHYHIDIKQIKQVTTAKYLGVTIDKNLNWSEHTSRVVNKANSVRTFFYNVMSESAVWKLNVCVTRVWSILYWNMQVSYGHYTINTTSTA